MATTVPLRLLVVLCASFGLGQAQGPYDCPACTTDPCSSSPCYRYPDAECHCNPDTCEAFYTRTLPNGNTNLLQNCGSEGDTTVEPATLSDCGKCGIGSVLCSDTDATCPRYTDAACHLDTCSCQLFFTTTKPNGDARIVNCGNNGNGNGNGNSNGNGRGGGNRGNGRGNGGPITTTVDPEK